MHTQQVGEKIFLVNVGTDKVKSLIASYVLRGEKAIIVDCGSSASIPSLLSGLEELGVGREEVAYVALTHVHIDHAGGAGTLLQNLPNAKAVVHTKGAPHLVDPAKLWAASKKTLDYVAEIYGEPLPVAKDRVIIAAEDMRLDVGSNVKLRVIEAPGHAAHNLSYFEPESRGLFPGDSAGAYLSRFDTVLPTTPPPFRPDIALVTIDKLISLNPTILYYPHFGSAPDAVERLKTYAEQIKQWLKIAEDGVKRGESEETIRDRIFSEDTTIREDVREEIILDTKSNPIHRRTLFGNSIEGFVEFVKKSRLQ